MIGRGTNPEIRVIGKTLSHPNIVTIYSVEEDHGVHFITMEAA